VTILLQKRWEDADGNVFALRVGTGSELLPDQKAWKDGHRLPVRYGDISQAPDFKPGDALTSYMKTRNSKGKMVIVQEIGWADPSETPTHLLVMFSSSNHEAFNCHVGNNLWIDNVKLEY